MTQEPTPDMQAELEKIKFDPWELMGPRNAAKRQELIFNATGEKIPRAKCGISAIGEALDKRFHHYTLAGCHADRPAALAACVHGFPACYRELRDIGAGIAFAVNSRGFRRFNALEIYPNGASREDVEEIAATYGATLDGLTWKLRG